MESPEQKRPRLFFPEPAVAKASTTPRPRLPFPETNQTKESMAQGSRRRVFGNEGTPSPAVSRRLPFESSPTAATPVSTSRPARADMFPQRAVEPQRAASDAPGMRVDPLIARAMEIAKSQYRELVEANEPRFRRKLEQLQGWGLQVVLDWGASAASKQADLASRVAEHTRDFSVLNAGEKLQATIRELTEPLSLVERLRGVERNVDKARLAMAGVKNGLLSMQPLNAKLLEEQVALKAELVMLVGTLSIAVDVFGKPNEVATEQVLDQRRRSLHMSATQASNLTSSLENMGGLMARQAGDIDHALNVTLTNVKLAQAQQK